MGRPKKNSDEERSRKKKKSKSGKRRRRDSSSLSYSYSSDSGDDDSRSRRRSRRSKKPEKRRKGSVGPDRRKLRKKAAKTLSRRAVSVSSSIRYSSRSCSTCRGRSGSPGSSSVSEGQGRRSRSHSVRSDRKGKSRAGGRPRGRRRERSQRRTSRSCSSCEGNSSGGTRGRSPVRHRSPTKEKFRQIERPRLLLPETTEAKESKAAEGRLRSINEDRDKTCKAYDEIPSSRNNATRTGYEHGYTEAGQIVVNKTGKQTPKIHCCDAEDLTNKKSESVNNVCHMEDEKDLESQLRRRALENLRKFRGGSSGNTKLADDLRNVFSNSEQADDSPELIEARQRALDSFRKVLGPPLPDTRATASMKKESSHTYHQESISGVVDAHDADKSLDCRNNASLDHGSIRGEHQQKPRIRSIVHIPAEEFTLNQEINIQHNSDNSGASNTSCQDKADGGQSSLHEGNTMEGSTKNMEVSELHSLGKEKQHEMTSEVVECSNIHNAEVNKAGSKTASRPSTLNMESGNGRRKEDSGSQFQQKTFSRMHDGELVQVSYKVYIPQKTPALARRKLQR